MVVVAAREPKAVVAAGFQVGRLQLEHVEGVAEPRAGVQRSAAGRDASQHSPILHIGVGEGGSLHEAHQQNAQVRTVVDDGCADAGLLGGTAVEELVIPVDTKQTGARVAAARHVDTVRGGHLDVAVGQSAGEHLKPARPARQRRELIEQPVQAGILVRGAGTAHGPRD